MRMCHRQHDIQRPLKGGGALSEVAHGARLTTVCNLHGLISLRIYTEDGDVDGGHAVTAISAIKRLDCTNARILCLPSKHAETFRAKTSGKNGEGNTFALLAASGVHGRRYFSPTFARAFRRRGRGRRSRRRNVLSPLETFPDEKRRFGLAPRPNADQRLTLS